MEQMVLRAQEQPCRCWRGNRPSGGYCFPFFSPSVLCSSFSVLRTPRSDSELCNFEGCSQLSPPGCLPELSSLSLTCELIQLWSCSGSAPLWLCGGSGTQLPPPTCLLTKAFPREVARLLGHLSSPQNFQKPQEMETLSFLSGSAQSFLWSQGLSI